MEFNKEQQLIVFEQISNTQIVKLNIKISGKKLL
jgi:hypothetical protein